MKDKHDSSYQNSSYRIRVWKLFYTQNWSPRILKISELYVWLNFPPKRSKNLSSYKLYKEKNRKPSLQQHIFWKQENKLQSTMPAARLLYGCRVDSFFGISSDRAVSDREIYRNECLWIVNWKALGEMKKTLDKKAHFLYIINKAKNLHRRTKSHALHLNSKAE